MKVSIVEKDERYRVKIHHKANSFDLVDFLHSVKTETKFGFNLESKKEKLTISAEFVTIEAAEQFYRDTVEYLFRH